MFLLAQLPDIAECTSLEILQSHQPARNTIQPSVLVIDDPFIVVLSHGAVIALAIIQKMQTQQGSGSLCSSHEGLITICVLNGADL